MNLGAVPHQLRALSDMESQLQAKAQGERMAQPVGRQLAR